MKADLFDRLAKLSRNLHGHMYVLPVACWIFEGEISGVSVAEAMAGLGGKADRPRIIEALVRLTRIGALTELARPEQRNSPRFFERAEDPFWVYVDALLASLRAEGGGRRGAPQFSEVSRGLA
ncbi:MAG: hypothetical protein QOI72_587 [Solirubrobacterales bacterium]|jgi:hypothetical protein|nr:hypothetical protein [Solirubrobacterales bacterium]